MDEKLEEETNEQPHKKQRATAPAEQTSSVDDYMEITLAYSSQFPLQTSIHNHLARGFSSFPRLKTPRRVVRDSTTTILIGYRRNIPYRVGNIPIKLPGNFPWFSSFGHWPPVNFDNPLDSYGIDGPFVSICQ
jgi:hypothetical protein